MDHLGIGIGVVDYIGLHNEHFVSLKRCDVIVIPTLGAASTHLRIITTSYSANPPFYDALRFHCIYNCEGKAQFQRLHGLTVLRQCPLILC